jgi:hypothetical protein
MPTDTLTITDPNPIAFPIDPTPYYKTYSLPFEGTPEVTGSAGLALADDSNGDQTQIVLPDDMSWSIQVDLVATVRPSTEILWGGPNARMGLTCFPGMTTGGVWVSVNYGELMPVSILGVLSQPPNWSDPIVEVWAYREASVEILERTLSVLPRGPVLPHARYTSSAVQPVVANTDVLVAFEDEATFHHLISQAKQGDGHRFTFRESGVWTVTATTRFIGGGGAGERYSALVSNNYGSPQVITAAGGYNGSAPETANLSYTGYFPKGSYVEVSTWQNGEDSLDLEGAEIWKNITFAQVKSDGSEGIIWG